MPSQGSRQRGRAILLAMGLWLFAAGSTHAGEVLRFSQNLPGDSKPVVLRADQITTWVDGSIRYLLLKGRVLIEHGVVQIRCQQAAGRLDLDRYKRTNVMRLDLYAEGDVHLENGLEKEDAPVGVFDLSTRGELKLRNHVGKVSQEANSQDPLFQRALIAWSGQAQASPPMTQIQVPQHNPVPIFRAVSPESDVLLAQGAAPPPDRTTPATSPPAASPGPAPGASAAPNAPATQPAPSFPGARPSAIPMPPGPMTPGDLLRGPVRQFSILPRTPGGYEQENKKLPNGEYVIIITGGVILVVRTTDNQGLIDMEADRLVFWTKDNPADVMSKLRTTQGQNTRELEFYLAGNVEIRQQSGKDVRKFTADEVFYDVGRNVAIALNADLEFHQPGLPDPIHLKAQELQQLSPDVFKGMRAEVFTSRLPSDPGLKVFVQEATIERKRTPRRSIFGRQFVNRETGQPETEEQRLFTGTNMQLKIEDVPVFYFPFVQGDANHPLGPLESASISANRVFGAQFSATFNVYDLFGVDPIPGTRWRFDVDYLTRRGPALGTNFDYSGKSFFGAPALVTGRVKAFGIYDTGEDILGGDRGSHDDHPDWRGRFFWLQNVQDLPDGFSLQSQVSALSDKNFLEQYYKNEFDLDMNQETFIYLKQQQDNWAWTALAKPNIRRWVNETEWLPRADGYLIGHSFFDLLTYNVHGSAGYAQLKPTREPPPPFSPTTVRTDTGRFDLTQELSLPFNLGPFRVVPYGFLDLTYYTEDLTGQDQGRFLGGGGVRGSISFSRLFPDVQNELFNVKGIFHKATLSSNYFIAHSDTMFSQLPQLDRLNDDASDQSVRDMKPRQPFYIPGDGIFLATSPLYDPQRYAIRRLVMDRIDTRDSIDVLQLDLRQRWQTKRGYPGQEHVVDWMTLDLSGSIFPHSQRDNFGETLAFLEYDWLWNVGDRTALSSSGWFDPIDHGARVFNIGVHMNRPDRTSMYLGYRQIEPLDSQAVIASATYIFSPKYAMTATAVYDFGINTQVTSMVFTRMGSDLQVSMGLTYNSLLNSFGFTFELLPNVAGPSRRLPGLASLGPNLMR